MAFNRSEDQLWQAPTSQRQQCGAARGGLDDPWRFVLLDCLSQDQTRKKLTTKAGSIQVQPSSGLFRGQRGLLDRETDRSPYWRCDFRCLVQSVEMGRMGKLVMNISKYAMYRLQNARRAYAAA